MASQSKQDQITIREDQRRVDQTVLRFVGRYQSHERLMVVAVLEARPKREAQLPILRALRVTRRIVEAQL